MAAAAAMIDKIGSPDRIRHMKMGQYGVSDRSVLRLEYFWIPRSIEYILSFVVDVSFGRNCLNGAQRLNDLNVLNGLRQVLVYFPDQTRLKKPLLSISSR